MGRSPQNPLKVPFNQVVQLKLRPIVKGMKKEGNSALCLSELAILFGCFKNSNFNDKTCAKEIKMFNDCYARENKKLTEKNKNLSDTEIRELLIKYPNL